MLPAFEILKAVTFAEQAHRGQLRRYTKEPYLVHCLAVARTVSITQLPGNISPQRHNMIIASLLHDVVEDTLITVQDIKDVFGEPVSLYVKDLTDCPPGYGNRAQRKIANDQRLAVCGDAVKIIKCADILDNMHSILEHDPKFAKVFMKEVGDLIPVLEPTSFPVYPQSLWLELVEQHRKGVQHV